MIRFSIFLFLGVTLATLSAWGTQRIQGELRQVAAERRAPLLVAGDAETLRNRLREEPLQPSVLRQLGTLGGGQGEDLLLLSERVSRRDPVTQILLLDRAAKAGDLGRTLAHYDVLLSTSPSAAPALSRQLSQALGNPEVAQRLQHYRDRTWFTNLLFAALSHAKDPRNVARLAESANTFSEPKTAELLTPRLLSALVKAGHVAEAFHYAGVAATEGMEWRHFGFSPASMSPRLAPLTWSLSSNPSARAEVAPSGGVAITASPLASAQPLRRLTNLAPGSYELEQTRDNGAGPTLGLRWRVTCIDAGRSQLAWEQPVFNTAAGSATDTLTLPAGCPFQEWVLIAVGEDAQTPSRAILEKINLRPVK